jgi:hypothetical protein
MPIDPLDKPPAPSRIILPGGEPASEPEGGAPSRIILPPGVTRETPEDLPEYPRLRPLVLMPFSDGQRELLLVTDPLGVIQGQPVLGAESLAILQLLDGTVPLNDIMAAVTRESKDIRVANLVKDFVAQLDRMLMLEGPRFETAYARLRDEYHQLEIRPASLEGHSYPAEPAELAKFLDGHYAQAEGMIATAGGTEPARTARPRAIMAPHLDPRRSGPAMARAFMELGPEQAEPIRVVVFGTGHSLLDDRVALTRKHFQTPLGKAVTDTAFVDRVAARLGEAAWRGELAHRDEHSIEFQVLYLQHRLGERPFQIVPILAGGFHSLLDDGKKPTEDPLFEAMVQAVREAEAALPMPTVYVAGVDFSHVGPRFGDKAVDERIKGDVEKLDREAIAAAERGDADAWFTAIAAHDDSTRVCGFAPTYAMLRCAEPGAGRVLRYEQSDEPDSTVVSIASMVWP